MKRYIVFIFIIILSTSCAFFEELVNPSDVREAIETGIDSQSPQVIIQTPSANGISVSRVYTLTGIVNDNKATNISNVFVSLDNGAFSSIPFSQSSGIWSNEITLFSRGEHTNYIYAVDNNGNRSTNFYRIVMYNGATALAGIDQTASNGQAVTLSGSASGSEVTPLVYSWTSEATNPTNVLISNADTQTATFIMPSAPGAYTFTLTVFDGALSNKDTVTIYRANIAPLVDAGTDQGVESGSNITLSGTATDADNDSLTYSWSADIANPTNVILTIVDSNTATFAMPTNEGKYIFTLTVWDGTVSNSDDVYIYHGSAGLSYTLTNSNTEYSVSNNTFTSGVLVIPGVYSNKPVTYIDIEAFSNCSGITEVIIPDSIADIGDFSFFDCALSSFNIPSSVTNYGMGTLSGCDVLTNIKVDASNQYYKDIDGVLFSKNAENILHYPAGLSGVYTIPDSVLIIWGGAFYSCTGLTNVIIPTSVVSISGGAFMSSTGIKSISIPESVTNIDINAFMFCNNLTNVTMASEIPPTLGEYAFIGTSVSLEIHVPNASSWSNYVTNGNWTNWAGKIVYP